VADSDRLPARLIVRAAPADLRAAAVLFKGDGGGAAGFAEAPGTLAYVASAGDEIQGWCWGYLLPRPDGAAMLYLHHLEVGERWRRRGVARALLSAFLDAGVRAGATRMFLTTGEHNTAARRLYESMGASPAAQGPTVNYWFGF
jgi:ribosomal protein S18 acetylase RimI-like enzyme